MDLTQELIDAALSEVFSLVDQAHAAEFFSPSATIPLYTAALEHFNRLSDAVKTSESGAYWGAYIQKRIDTLTH
jgi:hypothetical protein